MIRNIIFDWSGTLVDDLPAVWEATNAVFRAAGREALTLERFRAEFCLPFMRFYERHLPEVPMDQLEAWFHGTFQHTQASVVELPHAREFLNFCRQRGLRTLVLTSVRRDHYERQAAALGFAGFIDHPYPEVRDKVGKIHEVLVEQKLDPRETLFVGDMQHDIDTAKHGGVFACAVLTGYNSVSQLRASGPDLMVEHLGELRQVLERNGMALGPGDAAGGPQPAYPVATVGALIFNDPGQVLMVRTQKWSDLWGIPGGKIRYGEKLGGGVAAGAAGGNQPGGAGDRVRAGAGLHRVAGVLPRGALRLVELYVPVRGGTAGAAQRGGGGFPVGDAGGGAEDGVEPTHAPPVGGGGQKELISHGPHCY